MPGTTFDQTAIADEPLRPRELVAWMAVYLGFAAATLGYLHDTIDTLVPVWLPAGIGFGLQYRARGGWQRFWVFVAVAAMEFAAEKTFGKIQNLELYTVYALCIATEGLIGGLLSRALTRRQPPALDDVRGLGVFVLAAVVATLTVGSVASYAEITLANKDSWSAGLAQWLEADLVGILVVSPLVIARRLDAEFKERRALVSSVLLFSLLVGLTVALFGLKMGAKSPLVALSILVVPPLIWLGLRFGVVGASAGSLLLSVLVGVFTETGYGPIAALGYAESDRQWISQFFVGLVSISALMLGALTRERRRATQLLEAAVHDLGDASARFRVLFEGMEERLAVVDRDGRLVLANRGWMQDATKLHGTAPAIGTLVEHIGTGPRGVSAEAAYLWRRALAGEGATRVWRSEDERGDREFDVTFAPIRSPEGGVVGAYMTIRSLDERRQREQSEARARRLETVGRLAGGVAHDFNNIITAIIGYAELAKLDLAGKGVATGDLDEIRRSGERGAALTRQLLAYARRQVIEPRRVRLDQLLEGLKSLLLRIIGEDVALQIDMPASLWPVRADPGQLEQVVMNLAVNSRDAMPRGGRLVITGENVVIEESDAMRRDVAPGEYVQLSVSDTGVGIASDVMDRLFEPFFTTKEPGRGTGLGLSTVEGVVRQAGGAISVYSEVGIGSTFRVYLPRDHGTTTGEHVAVTPVPATSGEEKILLVEDDAALRALNARILERHGYQVLAYRDGRAAVEMPDALLAAASLLVTDVVLPELNGREVADRLRARAPHLKVLFISGYAEDAIVHHGILDEGVQFLAKPFTSEQLLSRVRKILDG